MKKRIILTSIYVIFLLLSSNIVFAPTIGSIGLCDVGDLKCTGRLIEECVESGSKWKTVEKCENKCKLNRKGVPFCVEDGEDGGKIKYIIILGFIIFLIWISRKITFRNKKIYFFKQQKEEIKEKLMYCKHCGSKVSKGSKFCSECGKKS